MKILFLGTHGQKNWGDELMLNVFVHHLSPVTDRLYINSYEPAMTAQYLDNPKVTVFNTQSDKIKLLWYLFQCDALIFGGGNILKELYVAYGGDRYSTLHMIDTLTKAARLARKPIYMCNIGVGPLETKQGRSIAKNILNRAQLTIVRDSGSSKLLESLNIDTPYHSLSDAVFSIDRAYLGLADNRKSRQINNLAEVKKIGINLCRNISNNDNWTYFIDNLANDLAKISQQNPKIQFIGIPMQFDVDNNNDSTAIKELVVKVRQTAPGVKFQIIKPTSLTELAKAIDQLDIFVGERLHALILSTIIGLPIVALEYDIKVTGVISDLGLDKYGLDINRRFETGSIYRRLDETGSSYKETAKAVKDAYTRNHKDSVESFAQLTQALKHLEGHRR